jgi:hypothetical protein
VHSTTGGAIATLAMRGLTGVRVSKRAAHRAVCTAASEVRKWVCVNPRAKTATEVPAQPVNCSLFYGIHAACRHATGYMDADVCFL